MTQQSRPIYDLRYRRQRATTLIELSISLAVIVVIASAAVFLREDSRKDAQGQLSLVIMEDIALRAERFYWQNCRAIEQGLTDLFESGADDRRLVVVNSNGLLNSHASLSLSLTDVQAGANALTSTFYDVYYERYPPSLEASVLAITGEVGTRPAERQLTHILVQLPMLENMTEFQASRRILPYLGRHRVALQEDRSINRATVTLRTPITNAIASDSSVQGYEAAVQAVALGGLGAFASSAALDPCAAVGSMP